MSTDIALIVQKLLLSIGEASIPGVGTLVLQRQGASYDKNKELIYPPSYLLDFKDNVDDNGKLLAYIVGYYNIDKGSALSALTDYTSQLLTSLENDQFFMIDGVGEFTLVDNKVLFNANKTTRDWFSNDLLQIKPIKVNKQYPPIITNTVVEPKTKDHSWRWLPLLFLLCIATIIIKYNVNKTANSDLPKFNQEPTEEIKDIIQDNSSVDSIENQEADIDQATGTCVIITGYFTKATNILKMTSMIESLGYKVFTEDIANGTRIGIKFDCNNMDLKQKIYNIRDSITKDAWYLMPPIKVE